jgi:hypothetical protein
MKNTVFGVAAVSESFVNRICGIRKIVTSSTHGAPLESCYGPMDGLIKLSIWQKKKLFSQMILDFKGKLLKIPASNNQCNLCCSSIVFDETFKASFRHNCRP